MKIGDWSVAARDVFAPAELCGTNLWLDLTSPLRKRMEWPRPVHKLGRVRRRYQVLADVELFVRVWGGYSPKFYDGYVTVLLEDWLSEHLINVVIIADQHFEWASKPPEMCWYLHNYQDSIKTKKSRIASECPSAKAKTTKLQWSPLSFARSNWTDFWMSQKFVFPNCSQRSWRNWIWCFNMQFEFAMHLFNLIPMPFIGNCIYFIGLSSIF